MAQIPDWTSLPQGVPTPSYRRVQIDNSAAEVDEAISRFGQGLEQAGGEVHASNVNFARQQSLGALAEHQLAVSTQTQQIRQDVADGKLPWDQAPQAFDKWQSQQPLPQINNLDPVGQQELEGKFKLHTLEGAQQVQQIAALGKKQAGIDTMTTTVQTYGKLAGLPGADIQSINNQLDSLRPQAIASGLPPATVDRALQEAKDRNWLNQATQRAMEAKESFPALKDLQHDLTAADGFYAGRLDTERRNMLLRTVENDQIILQNRAEHEQDKREAKAQRTIGQMDEQISSGIPATPDMWAQWEGQTQGTSFADDFKQRMKDEDQVQQVLRRPIDQQQAYVQQRAAQLESQGGTLRDRADLMRLQTAVNQNVNLMQKAPLLYAQNRTGTEVQPLDMTALNSPNPVASLVTGAAGTQGAPGAPDPKQTFQAQIADRMATLKALRTQYGSAIQPLPLLPQEVSQLSNQLENAPPGQRAQMLISLRSSMNDDTAYQAAMRQIAPKSPVTAIAGSMVGSSAPASTPAWFNQNFSSKIDDVGRILRGDALLHPSKGSPGQDDKGEIKTAVPMPPDGTANSPGLRDAFSSATKDLFRDRPELGETYFAAFKAADAALRAESGDLKGETNSTIEKKALKIALGNTVDFSGNRVKVPDGMDPSKFSGYVQNAVASVVKSAGGKDDWAQRLQGYRLHEIGGVGTGRYQLMDGALPIARPDGKGPLTIDLRNQYLPSSQGGITAQAPPPATASATQ